MSNWPIATAAGPVALRSGPEDREIWVPISTVAHTKAAWVELTSAPTAQDAAGLIVSIAGYGDGDSRHLIDVGIGPAGSERVLVENLHINAPAYRFPASDVHLPVAIPKGSRLSVRQQTDRTSSLDPLRVNASLVPVSGLYLPGMQCIGTYGADTTQTTLQNVPQYFGSQTWIPLAASVPKRARAIVMMYGAFHPYGGVVAHSMGSMSVAIGSAGSERPIVENMTHHVFSGRQYGTPWWGPYPCDIPAGSRISGCVTSSSANYYHAMGVVLFG